MARNQDIFETVVKLNTQQAQNELDKMKKTLDQLKADKDKILSDPNHTSKDLKDINKQIRQMQGRIKAYTSDVKDAIDTIANLDKASIGELEKAQRALKKRIKDVTDPGEFDELNVLIQKCTERITELKDTAKLTSKVLGDINGASLNELQETAKNLQQQLGNIKPNTSEFKKTEDSLNKIYQRINAIQVTQKDSNTLVSQYNQEMAKVKANMNNVADQDKVINGVLDNISKAKLPQIEYSIKMIKEQMRGLDIGSKEFELLSQKAKKLNTVMEEINNNSKATKGFWSRTANFFNTNWGFFTQALGAITGLTVTIRNATAAYAEMEDSMANVRKYTGQTDEQVRLMNENFKKMDTRTSREQLNELAGAAGRLGKQSKKDIEDFVDAADKINVALGDDLGKGAVDKIGKLANVFGEEDRLGLRKAMLATGSAINELAQNSSANAGYIVDFTADLAGVGRQANMTQAQIMGLASALDQNMQEEATASTVFSQLITKMFQDPAKFAQIAGLEVTKFTKLLKTNANEALLEFMQSMQNKGGFSEMAPMFESMNLNGTRAVGVLSSVATHLDQVRTAQDLATKEYAKGTSVLNEFNTNNNTANAELDKAKKKFQDLKIELGQRLLPVASMAISSGSLLVHTLEALVNFVVKYRSTIALLTVAITTLTIAKNADIIATKLAVFWDEKCLAGLKKLWTVVKANPYAALALVATAVVGVIIDLTRKTDGLTQAQKDLNKISDEAKVKAQEQADKIDILVKAAKNDKLSMDDRKKAIEELNKIIPGYNAKLDEETGRYRANEQALKDYNKQLQRKYELEGAKDMLRQLGKQRAQATVALDQAQKQLANATNAGAGYTYTTSWGMVGNTTQDLVDKAQQKYNKAKQVLNDVTTQIKAIEGSYGDDLQRDAARGSSDTSTNTKTDSSGGGSAYVDPKQQKKLEALRKKQEAEAKKREAAALKAQKAQDKMIEAETDLHVKKLLNAYSQGKITREEFINQREKVEKDGLDKRMKIWDKESTEYKDLQAKEEDATREKVDAINKLNARQAESEYNKEEQNINLAYVTKGDPLYMNEDARDEKLFNNEQDYIKKRIALAKIGSEEWFDLRDQLEENDNEHRIKLQQKHQERLNQYREQFGMQDIATQEKIALAGYDKIMKEELAKYKDNSDEKLKAEKDFQEMRKQIVLYYQEQESEQNLNNSAGEVFKRNANTAYTTASNNAKADYQNEHPTGTGAIDYIASDITVYSSTLTNLKQMENDAVITHQEAMSAMSQATADMAAGIASKMQAAYDAVSPIMDAMSSYYSAQCDLEVTQTEKKYEKLIDRAGNNQAKQKKLQEKQEKEIAKIKTKYNNKQVKIQIAQAIAQNALSALNAYASVMAGAPWPANQVLAPIAAGLALAAGAIQIATIKKQAQAQEAGYYEGGFTGGSSYRKEAGVVHQGEFVANHQAVNNPQLLPAFRLLDQAQRNNTVGTLTATDVSRSMGVGSTTVVSAPQVNVTTDNSQLTGTLDNARTSIDALNSLLASGRIIVKMPDWDEFDRSHDHWERVKGNK